MANKSPVLFGRGMRRRHYDGHSEWSQRFGSWRFVIDHYPTHQSRPFYACVGFGDQMVNWRWCASEAAAVKFIERTMASQLDVVRYLVEG
jgi:hypothetical protein